MNREETKEFFRFLEKHDFKVDIIPDISVHKDLKVLSGKLSSEDLLREQED